MLEPSLKTPKHWFLKNKIDMGDFSMHGKPFLLRLALTPSRGILMIGVL